MSGGIIIEFLTRRRSSPRRDSDLRIMKKSGTLRANEIPAISPYWEEICRSNMTTVLTNELYAAIIDRY